MLRAAAQTMSATTQPAPAPLSVVPPAPSTTAPSTTASSTTSTTPSSSDVSVGANGYIHGIDGMLDQISGALLRQAKTEILPTLQNDRALQETIGRAAGKAMAKPLWVIAGIAAVFVGWTIWQTSDIRVERRPVVRSNPRGGQRRSARTRSSRQRYYR